MESIFFLFGLLGVVLVIHWTAVNDRAGNHGKTSGLFAMRDPEPLRDGPGAKSGGKPGGKLAAKPAPGKPSAYPPRRA